MLRLRPFKRSDFRYLLEWMTDETSFYKWCAGKFSYPLTEEQLFGYFDTFEKDDQAWIMIAVDASGRPVGHLMMRNANFLEDSIHFGFIIVDPQQRGRGYGKALVQLAMLYVTTILKMSKVTLSVFDNNPNAHQCYLKIGFKDVDFRDAAFLYREERWGLFDMAYVAEDV